MYREHEELVYLQYTLLFFPTPYSPQIIPIDVGFSQLKQWFNRHASMVFRYDARRTLNVAITKCAQGQEQVGHHLYRHCGYKLHQLNHDIFLS